jgi:hypothetical protein
MVRITRERMLGVLGPAPKPKTVWQKQFDYDDAVLTALAGMDWDHVPPACLNHYFMDLAYVDLQPDLFRHLFPACLKYWYETLMRNDDASTGEGEFHYALSQGQILQRMLSANELQASFDFFRDGMLDRLEAERGCALKVPSTGASGSEWILRLNSLGIVAPVIKPIWDAWWDFDRPGKAFSALIYASGLIYPSVENPIFKGAGGPYLTETDSLIFDRGWSDDNLNFLRTTLSVPYVIDKAADAASALLDCPEAELAARIAGDAKGRAFFVELRIGNLLAALSKCELDRGCWE